MTRGRVVRIEGHRAEIATASTSECTRCRSGRGCGLSLLTRRPAGGELHLWATAPAGLQVGQQVTLGIQPVQLMWASLTAYGPALAGLVGGIAAGQSFGTEAAAAAGGAIGLALGLALGHRSRFQPELQITAAEQ